MKQESIEEKRKRRKKEAVCGVLFFALLQLACAICFGSLCFIPDAPVWLFVMFLVLALFCLVLIISALWALHERFKEINGGELDAAAQY